MLFRDHTHLLEEYWVFFERLHPTVQCRSDDEEEEEEMECDTDSVCSVQTVHSVASNQECQPIITHLSEERTEARKSPTNNKDRVDLVTQDVECLVTGPEVEDETSGERDVQCCHQTLGSPVCAKNSSRMPSGEKVVLWTREADRVILTTCQHRGASQSTFSSIAAQLGNKTATEVSARYRDLIKLFHRSCMSPREEEPG